MGRSRKVQLRQRDARHFQGRRSRDRHCTGRVRFHHRLLGGTRPFREQGRCKCSEVICIRPLVEKTGRYLRGRADFHKRTSEAKAIHNHWNIRFMFDRVAGSNDGVGLLPLFGWAIPKSVADYGRRPAECPLTKRS